MFEVTATGKNTNYGKDGEKRTLNDHLLVVALKNEWITNDIKFIGSPRLSTHSKIYPNEKLMPFKAINIQTTLDNQQKAINLMVTKLKNMIIVNKALIKMVKDKEEPLEAKR